MSDEKLKTNESQNSLKGKSTVENSKIYDGMKSIKNSKKSKENHKFKKAKNVVIIQKSKKFDKSSGTKINKTNEKNSKTKIKNNKFNKIEIKNTLPKTLIRTKTTNKMLDKIKEEAKKSDKTPMQSIKKSKDIKKPLITLISSSRNKIKEIYSSKTQRSKNKKLIKNNITVYKEPFLTIQNSNKVSKNKNIKIKSKQKKVKDNKEKNSEELDNISLEISPKIITDKMYRKEKSYSQINKTFNNIRKFTLNSKNNKNKEDSIINKFDSIKKNKTKKIKLNISNNDSFNKTIHLYPKDKILNSQNSKTNNYYLKKSYKNNINKSSSKNENYLKTENNDNKKKENKNNIYYSKKEYNKSNYLKYTVSSLNKIVKKKKKKEINKSLDLRTINNENKTKTIKRNKTNNKMKTLLIFRNTISRYKLYKKNLLSEDKNIQEFKNKDHINFPNESKFSTIHSAKNIFNKIDKFRIIKSLGKGSYGEVKLGINKIDEKKYAIKIYPKKILCEPQKKGIIENEIKILQQLNNINIMKLYEVIHTPILLYLIMEYIDGISLLEIIKKENNHYLEEKRALKIFIQIVKAIDYCQSKNICHRDIKLENILILNDGTIKLIDFGFAVKSNKKTYQTLLCGSPSYMAPEIVKREKYIAQYSDIWSLGVLLYSMLYGRFPFQGKTQKELFDNIKNCEFEFPNDINTNENTINLIKRILVVNPNQRPSLKEILNDISNIIYSL